MSGWGLFFCLFVLFSGFVGIIYELKRLNDWMRVLAGMLKNAPLHHLEYLRALEPLAESHESTEQKAVTAKRKTELIQWAREVVRREETEKNFSNLMPPAPRWDDSFDG